MNEIQKNNHKRLTTALTTTLYLEMMMYGMDSAPKVAILPLPISAYTPLAKHTTLNNAASYTAVTAPRSR